MSKFRREEVRIHGKPYTRNYRRNWWCILGHADKALHPDPFPVQPVQEYSGKLNMPGTPLLNRDRIKFLFPVYVR